MYAPNWDCDVLPLPGCLRGHNLSQFSIQLGRMFISKLGKVRLKNTRSLGKIQKSLKPLLHIHDSGHGRAKIQPDLSNCGATVWFLVAP